MAAVSTSASSTQYHLSRPIYMLRSIFASAIAALLLLAPLDCPAEPLANLSEATIKGHKIKVGQPADIVQSRIQADAFTSSGYNYGDPSTARYNDAGTTYVVIFGPPKGGSGTYVVTSISRIPPTTVAKTTGTANEVAPKTLSREDIISARRSFKVQVVSFDASRQYGNEFPYSDMVELAVSNGSSVVLQTLTVLVKRFGGNGTLLGFSRIGVTVSDLRSGSSVTRQVFPRGQLPGATKITAEIESRIAREDEQFFAELRK